MSFTVTSVQCCSVIQFNDGMQDSSVLHVVFYVIMCTGTSYIVVDNSTGVPTIRSGYPRPLSADWPSLRYVYRLDAALYVPASFNDTSHLYLFMVCAPLPYYYPHNYNGRMVCLSVCLSSSLAPSMLHGRGPRLRHLNPRALGTWPPTSTVQPTAVSNTYWRQC